MTDNPKCPPKVWIFADRSQGYVLSSWTEMPDQEQIDFAAKRGVNLVEYIPRHSIDRLLDAADDLVEAIAWFGRDEQVTVDAIKRVADAIQEFRPDA